MSTYRRHDMEMGKSLYIFSRQHSFSTVSIIGFIANFTVIITILTSKQARNNVTNLFILTLAAADIVQCSINWPLRLYIHLQPMQGAVWNLGPILCKVVRPLLMIPLHVSSTTMFFIAIGR